MDRLPFAAFGGGPKQLFVSCCIVLAWCGSLTLTIFHHTLSLTLSIILCHVFVILQKDLVKRLRALTKVLETDPEVDVDSPEWPGLNATAALLVTDEYLQHADKEVRLYTVTACMELFAIVSIASWSTVFCNL